jgi:hypothetical protein
MKLTTHCSCEQYSFGHQIILVVTQFLVSGMLLSSWSLSLLTVAVIAILCTYALYSRDKRVLGGLVILGVCLMAVSSVRLVAGSIGSDNRSLTPSGRFMDSTLSQWQSSLGAISG